MTGTGVETGRRKTGVGFTVGLGAVLIVVMWSGVCAAEVLNPSFETTYDGLPWPRPLPLYWWKGADHPSFNSFCTGLWSTDGDLSLALLSRAGTPIRYGDSQSFSQWAIDLTGVSSIVFDVKLMASAGVFDHFEASFVVDGFTLWHADEEGDYYDQEVSVVGLPESWWGHYIEIRLTALDTSDELGFAQSYWALWDNVRLQTEPTTIPAAIDLEPGTLNLRSNGKWVTCYIELAEGYSVGDIEGTTVTLDDISAYVDGRGWATSQASEDNITDHDGDGILERMVKFRREDVQAVVQSPRTLVTVLGCLTDGTAFEGTAVLQVLDQGAKKK